MCFGHVVLLDILLQVADTDITKEAKPSFYRKYILPILHLNRVVHFVGFGNRLASDPIPPEVQVDNYPSYMLDAVWVSF